MCYLLIKKYLDKYSNLKIDDKLRSVNYQEPILSKLVSKTKVKQK